MDGTEKTFRRRLPAASPDASLLSFPKPNDILSRDGSKHEESSAERKPSHPRKVPVSTIFMVTLISLCLMVSRSNIVSYDAVPFVATEQRHVPTYNIDTKYPVSDTATHGEPSNPQSDESTDRSTQRMLCFGPRYGQMCNQILSVAKGLRMARAMGSKLLFAGPLWMKLGNLLTPHPDITWRKFMSRKEAEQVCWNATLLHSAIAFEDGGILPHQQVSVPELQELLPREEIRQRSMEILWNQYNLTKPSVNHQEAPLPFVSVHRRWLEGQCVSRSQDGEKERYTEFYWNRASESCTAATRKWTCLMTYSQVKKLLLGLHNLHSAQDYERRTKLPVILFTDGQAKEYDESFPIRGQNEMMEELWMMVQSEIHVGNPMSTVEMVVHHWRQTMPWWQRNDDSSSSGAIEDRDRISLSSVGMEPAACFSPNEESLAMPT